MNLRVCLHDTKPAKLTPPAIEVQEQKWDQSRYGKVYKNVVLQDHMVCLFFKNEKLINQ